METLQCVEERGSEERRQSGSLHASLSSTGSHHASKKSIVSPLRRLGQLTISCSLYSPPLPHAGYYNRHTGGECGPTSVGLHLCHQTGSRNCTEHHESGRHRKIYVLQERMCDLTLLVFLFRSTPGERKPYTTAATLALGNT